MAEVRSRVKLEEVEILYVRPKIATTGAIILEVPGENSAARADLLAEKLRAALKEDVARVTRPVKMAEVRVSALDESVSQNELTLALSSADGWGYKGWQYPQKPQWPGLRVG